MVALILFGIFFILLFLSVPVSVALGASTLFTAYMFEGSESLIDLASALFSKLDKIKKNRISNQCKIVK